MKVLYFAWLRERIGTGEEEVNPPPAIATVGALMDWLEARSARHATGFAQRRALRFAVNQEIATLSTPVAPGDEVAFFPPVTGG